MPGTVPTQSGQQGQQQSRPRPELPTVVEPDLGAGSSDLDVPDFLK